MDDSRTAGRGNISKENYKNADVEVLMDSGNRALRDENDQDQIKYMESKYIRIFIIKMKSIFFTVIRKIA